MSELAGQIALVTGGARRIGREIAIQLAAAGAGVVIHYNTSGADAKSLVKQLKRDGHAAWALQGNLSGAGTEKIIAAAAKLAGGHLSLLVNNASTFPAGRIASLKWADLTDSLQTNAWAPFELTRALAKQLPDDKQGSVVNLLDARVVDDDREHAAYWLAKRMLTDLTRLCAIEYAPRLRINGVAPGAVLPPDDEATFPPSLAAQLPLGRHGTPADVARAVLQLLAAESTTGQVLYVDGGRHLGRQPTAGKTHQAPRR
jgi:pteridine reductase